MISEFSIKEKVSAFLRDEISLEDFQNWLLPAAWNMFSDSSDAAINLASSIHLLLDERDDHILSDADLRESLFRLLDNVAYIIESTPNPIRQTVHYQPSPAIAYWVAESSARRPALVHVIL